MKPRCPDELERRLHADAVSRGAAYYIDPRTGLCVFTEIGLARQGSCCGSGCLHCPYPVEEQRRAGRPG